MDKIAVLIPCYNEAQTIGKVVRDFKAVLPDAVVYVYDNNSKDDTAKIAAEAGAIVRHEYQQGKGNVVRRMFREINAQCYIMTDGDDTYPAEFAPAMVKKVLERHVDMVVGDRLSSTYYEENKRPFHNFGNSLVKKSINLLFKNDIKDIMTGYRAFSYEFVKTFPVLSKGFEIETEMSIHAVDKNLLVENEIIEYRDRPEGSESKLNTYSDGMKVLLTIARLFRSYKPFAFFSGVAVILLIAASIMFAPILVTYIRTGLVPQFPTLIVCGFMVMAAIQSFFGGLILGVIIQKNRQEFEFKLQIENEKKDALIAKYHMLSDEDKADIIAHKEEYTLEQIDEKLALIYVRKNVDFSTVDGHQEEEADMDSILSFSLDDSKDAEVVSDIQAAFRSLEN